MGSFQPAARIDAETEALNPRWVSADTTLRPGNQNVVADSSSNTVDVTMADIAECAGNIVCVIAPDGASNDVSVVTNETGTEIAAGGDMDADDDVSVFYCTGLIWVVLSTTVA